MEGAYSKGGAYWKEGAKSNYDKVNSMLPCVCSVIYRSHETSESGRNAMLYLLKLINNSSSNKENHNRKGGLNTPS